MQKLTVLLIAITLAPIAFADDAKSTTPKLAPQARATTTSSAAGNDQILDVSLEQFQKQMVASQDARLPFMAKEIELKLRTQLKVLGDPESSAMLARYIHNLYENLIKEGFSKEEALQIASRVPSPPQMSRPIY